MSFSNLTFLVAGKFFSWPGGPVGAKRFLLDKTLNFFRLLCILRFLFLVGAFPTKSARLLQGVVFFQFNCPLFCSFVQLI